MKKRLVTLPVLWWSLFPRGEIVATLCKAHLAPWHEAAPLDFCVLAVNKNVVDLVNIATGNAAYCTKQDVYGVRVVVQIPEVEQ